MTLTVFVESIDIGGFHTRATVVQSRCWGWLKPRTWTYVNTRTFPGYAGWIDVNIGEELDVVDERVHAILFHSQLRAYHEAMNRTQPPTP